MNRRLEYIQNTSAREDLQTENCKGIVVVVDQATGIAYTGHTGIEGYVLRDDVEELIRDQFEREMQNFPYERSL